MYRIKCFYSGHILEVEHDRFISCPHYYYKLILRDMRRYWYYHKSYCQKFPYLKCYVCSDDYLVAVIYYRPGFTAWHCFNVDGSFTKYASIDMGRLYHE